MTVEEMLKDKAFVEDLASSKSLEEAQAKLDEKGVDVRYEDLVKAVEYMQKKQDGDLTEEALETVSGGITSKFYRTYPAFTLDFDTEGMSMDESIYRAKKPTKLP